MKSTVMEDPEVNAVLLKLTALELWGRRLDQILTPDGGENVVPLPTRAG